MRVHCSDEEQQDASGYRHRPDSQQSFIQHLVRDFKEYLKSYSRKDQEQIWILTGRDPSNKVQSYQGCVHSTCGHIHAELHAN
jgi:hypothetical protein